jgi:hypothetical protein
LYMVLYVTVVLAFLFSLACPSGFRKEALKICHSPARACVYDDRGLAARYGYGSDSGAGCAKRLVQGKCPPKTKP